VVPAPPVIPITRKESIMNTSSVPAWSDPPTTAGSAVRSSPARRFFGVVTRPQSYRNIVYLLLGLPLGTLWFSVLVTVASVSVSLLVLALLGIPLLIGMWYVVRAFANLERGVANGLLGEHIASAPMAAGVTGNLWVRLREMSRDRGRWREFGYLLLRFPAGIATFTVATVALSVPLWLIWTPFHVRVVDDEQFGDWAGSSWLEDFTTSPWAWTLVPVGIALLFVALHAMNALARACGRWARMALA
jgi:hypothetical protein